MRKVVALLVLAGASLSVSAAEVVILHCSANANPMTVTSVTASTGAPAVTVGANCAQTLANLIDNSYRIVDADGTRIRPTIVYTLWAQSQCNDGLDNDQDGFVDGADPQCTGATDNNEGA